MQEQAEQFRSRYNDVKEQIGRVIVGHDDIVHGVLTCLLIGGHCLLERRARAGQNATGAHVGRRRASPRLLADSIHTRPDAGPTSWARTWSSNRPKESASLEFQKGPIFTQICLADEINRATPKTQSAMLETMQEGTNYSRRYAFRTQEAVLRVGHPEPDRARGHLSVARSATRPFSCSSWSSGIQPREELATIIDRTTARCFDSSREGDGGRRDPPLAAADSRRDTRPTRARFTSCGWTLATHPEGPFRPADHKPVSAAGAAAPAVRKHWLWPQR